MRNKEITEKEFAIISEISKNHFHHQRMISEKTGISLGLTNLIIKKLVKKGLVKAKQLNKRKVQYILTPKGFVEKAKKSYSFTLKTIDSLRSIKENIQNLILTYIGRGVTNFVILGENELSDIAFNTLKTSTINKFTYSIIHDYKSAALEENNSILYLITEDKNISNKNSINLISYLSESGVFIQ